MTTFPLTVFLIAVGLTAVSQTRISGTIISDKKMPVANANILLKDTYDGTSSDSSGHFSFTTAETGKMMLVFSSVNYEKDSVAISLTGSAISLTLVMREAANQLNTVSISAGTFVAGDSKKGAILTAVEIATTAGTRADIFAAMQTLPGAQTNFSESGLFVRGGTAAETKTYFDGMLVKSPFNASVPDQASRGKLSAFMFKGTSFSAGGYSAEYGQALSSALVLESTDLPEKTTTGITLLSVGGGIDRNIRYKKSALSIDSYYYNLAPAYSIIKQQHDFIKAPEQFGGTVQYKATTSATGLFKMYASYGRSILSLHTNDIDHPATPGFLSNYNHDLFFNSTYHEFFGKWKIDAGLSYNHNGDTGIMQADNYARADHFSEAKVTLTHTLGRLSGIKFGGETSNGGRFESLAGDSRGYTDHLSAGFAETDLYFTPKLVARVGLRAEYSSYLGKSNLAPRTSLALKTGAHSQVAMAYGTFYENPEDDYLVIKPLDFERADHYLLRYERNTTGRNFRVEGYYKTYQRLTKISSGGIPDNSGSGFAKGADVFWRDKKSIKNADYRISYSYLDTKRNMLDFPVAATPGFAAKHTMSVVYSQFFSKINSQVGTVYTFASGRTYVNPNNPAYRTDLTKDYNNLSLSVSYLTHILKQFTVVYLNATNIAGFKNIYGYQYSSDGRTRRPILPSSRRDVIIGLLMTIGDNTFVR